MVVGRSWLVVGAAWLVVVGLVPTEGGGEEEQGHTEQGGGEGDPGEHCGEQLESESDLSFILESESALWLIL